MSGKRNLVFAENEYYHAYNRSTANEQIFAKKQDVKRALDIISFYRYKQALRFSFYNRLKHDDKKEYLQKLPNKKSLVTIYAYSLMPNHYHLLLKQNSANGIQKFLSDFQNGFAKYFNVKNKRSGSLFQRPFKAKHIETEEELLHISRYIHLNPTTSYMMEFEELKKNHLTSLPLYLNNEQTFVNTGFITGSFGNSAKYEKFVADQVDYQKKLADIKHLLLK
ncbi:MAG: transposase [Patescibacteria group bacterium]